MKRLAGFAVIAWCGFGLAGAAVSAATPGLEEARARWHDAGIEAYRYEYRKFCECHPTEPATTVVTVGGGRVREVRYRVAGLPDVVLAPDRIGWYWTIEDLFALLAVEQDNRSLRVSFEPSLGYPMTIYFDRDPAIEGDEIDVRVSSLVPLAN